MTITSTAYALLKGYAHSIHAEQSIKDEIALNRTKQVSALITAEDYADAALSGDNFPDNPHFDNERARSERLNISIRGELLKSAIKVIQARRTKIIREHGDEALGYLDSELTKLMAEVRTTHDALGGVRTAQDVLNANDPRIQTAWRSRELLISRYNEIRAVQYGLTNPSLPDGEGFKIAAVGHLRNSLEQADFWLSRRQASASPQAANDRLNGVANFDSWLRDGGTAHFKHSTSAIPSKDNATNAVNPWDYLVWLATKAEPWVPTAAQIMAAYDAAHLAVGETDYKKYRAQEAGRDEYFEVIDRNPLVAYTNGSGQEKPETRKRKIPSFGESAVRHLM